MELGTIRTSFCIVKKKRETQGYKKRKAVFISKTDGWLEINKTKEGEKLSQIPIDTEKLKE